MEDSSSLGVLPLPSSNWVAFSLLSAASSGIHQRLVRRRKASTKKDEIQKDKMNLIRTQEWTQSQSSQQTQHVEEVKPSSQLPHVPHHQHPRPAPLIPPMAAARAMCQDLDEVSDSSDGCCDDTATTCSTSSDDLPASGPSTPIHRSPVPYLLPASVPRGVALLVTVGLVVAWFACTEWRLRMRALLQAALFAIIEFHFTGLTDDRAKRYWPPARVGAWKRSGMLALEKIAHALHISLSSVPAPVTRVWRTGYTTWEMFGASVLWMPIFSEFYFRVLFPGDSYFAYACRIGFYPLNVWVLEMGVGYFLSRIWGRRAWWYQDTWARFDGNITLKYGHYWLAMGIFHNSSFWHCALPFTEAVGEWLGVA